MAEFVFAPAASVSLGVAGCDAVFPVNRVFCIGRNYRWAKDGPATTEEMPPWFMKPASSVVPATGYIPYPPDTTEFCHEIELVVALGHGGKNIDAENVESRHIWGYAAGLDLTRRDLQIKAKSAGAPWEAAKAFDQAAPCTPLVPSRICGHPNTGAIWLTVNGIQRQYGDLSDLMWSVPQLVAMLSRSVTLLAGDLIFTGTPAGVGALLPGDQVNAGIAGIGQFTLAISG